MNHVRRWLEVATLWLAVGSFAILAVGVHDIARAAGRSLPYGFFFTHYEMLGDPNKPSGVKYASNGRPFAKAPTGETIAFSGSGGWNPRTRAAKGGGGYAISAKNGKVTAQWKWRVTGFISFHQVEGWWEPGFKELGWQGPPGSVSFSGFLILRVNLERHGDGVLMTWCLMPTVRMPVDHKGDGLMLIGPRLSFVDYKDAEMSAEGVMFYSTDPRASGYTLDAAGRTVLRKPGR